MTASLSIGTPAARQRGNDPISVGAAPRSAPGPICSQSANCVTDPRTLIVSSAKPLSRTRSRPAPQSTTRVAAPM